MIKTIIISVQLIFAVLLTTVILLQHKGAGLGAAFGGSSSVFSTRRGIDKVLFQATIVIAVLFFAASIASVLV